MRATCLKVVACLFGLFALSGCHRAPSLLVPSWSLVGAEGDTLRDVRLPGHFDGSLPRHDGSYALRARVELPPSLRDKPLSFSIPYFAALATLNVNGREVPSTTRGPIDTYRSNSHHWLLPSDIAESGKLDLELRVHHTWTQSAWLDTVPRLDATENGDLGFQIVRGSNLVFGAVSTTAIALLALLYGLISRLAKREVAYGWFGGAALCAIPFVAYPAGFLQPLLGRYEVAVAAVGIAASSVASARYARARLGVAPPSILWLLAVAALAGASVRYGGPFEATRCIVPAAVALVVANALLFLFLARRMEKLPSPPLNAFVSTMGWPLALFASVPDCLAWLGFGELVGGIRVGPIAAAGIVVAQAVALVRDHVLSLKRADELDTELARRLLLLEASHQEVAVLHEEVRHQVTVRSEHLADLLANRGAAPNGLELQIGDHVAGRYRIEGSLGAGAAGQVFEVSRLSDGRRFALKTMRRPRDRVDLARFAREALAASRVRHPNVVSLVDFNVEAGGALYLVMDLVGGPPLRQLQDRFGDAAWATPILRQIASGLAAVHAAGVVHRDLKPGNILLSDAGPEPFARIADFGIARAAGRGERNDDTTVVEGARRSPHPARGAASRPSLTETGIALGTPMYMAPEMLVGDSPPDFSVDVFAFGVVAFELFSGVRPYGKCIPAFASSEGLRGKLGERAPQLPYALVALVEQCLSRDPSARPRAEEIVRILGRHCAHPRESAIVERTRSASREAISEMRMRGRR